ncbi:MAG: hypothetical protein EHM40_02260 [Chloroflexi bacterium]|nr:MAG: hypothetical protein EHM40_14315 [Chloroflexota bacterium]RPI95897.1 MAG: hypothetical protein EHM40_02260 [Chloroflexota bacterium]
MQSVQANHPAANLSPKRILIFTSIFIALLFIARYVINTMRTPQGDTLPPGTVSISHKTLEEEFGLHVNLLAVTAGGGFVDVRLKILNSEKAKSLLQNPDNFPSLFIDNHTILGVSKEAGEQEIQFEDNGSLFIMFPNAGNAIKPGMRVRIMFGNIALEPMDMQ